MKIGIIFDLDGTLLDTLDDLHAAVNHTLAQFGCPPRTREEVRQFVGNGVDQLIRLSLPGTDHDPDLEEVIAAYRAYYNAHCKEKTGPYAGIPEVLAALAKEYPLAVVSNKQDAAVKPLCREYFGTIFALGIPTVMEFTGTADGLELAGRLVKSHGRLGIGGYHNDGRRSVDYCLWNFKAFTAINCHERRISYEADLCKRCMELMEKDIWKFRGVTKVYQIEDVDKGSDMMIKHTDGSIKVAFRF